MKKIFGAIALTLAGLLLASCGSTKETTAAATQAAEDGYPDWVYEGRRDSTGIYAVGSGKLANIQNSLTMARANGRAELARTLKTQVQDVLQTYVSDTGSDENRDSLTGLIDNTLQKTDAVLEGSEQVDRFTAKDGTIYVLMYLPYESAIKALNEEASSYTGKPEAIITELKMEEAYEKYFSKTKKH